MHACMHACMHAYIRIYIHKLHVYAAWESGNFWTWAPSEVQDIRQQLQAMSEEAPTFRV